MTVQEQLLNQLVQLSSWLSDQNARSDQDLFADHKAVYDAHCRLVFSIRELKEAVSLMPAKA